MELSIFLAKVMGLFLIVICTAILTNRKKIEMIVEELSVTKSLLLLTFSGTVMLIMGLLIVISHNVWTADWRVLITILGYLTLLKGILRIYAPEKVLPLARSAIVGSWHKIVSVLFLVLGLYLTYIGFLS